MFSGSCDQDPGSWVPNSCPKAFCCFGAMEIEGTHNGSPKIMQSGPKTRHHPHDLTHTGTNDFSQNCVFFELKLCVCPHLIKTNVSFEPPGRAKIESPFLFAHDAKMVEHWSVKCERPPPPFAHQALNPWSWPCSDVGPPATAWWAHF